MHNRTMKLLSALLLAASFLTGCAAQSGQEAGQSALPAENLSAVGLAVGDTVSISGEDHSGTLHSLDLLDETTGYILQDQYSAEGKAYSQLLATQDGGTHWNKVGTDDTAFCTVRFTDRETGWAVSQTSGTGSGDIRYTLLHTEDGGRRWTAQWQSKPGAATAPELWFSDSTSGYALVGGSLLVTRDGGTHWSAQSLGRDFTPQHLCFTNASTGWISGIGGKNSNVISILHTKDSGAHWSVQFQKEYSDSYPIGTIGIDFAGQNTGWFLTSDLGTWEGELYNTKDGGTHWEKINEIRCIRPTPAGLCFVSAQVGWIPLDPGAGPIAGGLMVTRDGGKSFQVLGGSGADSSEDAQKITNAQEVEFLSKEQGWAIGRDSEHGDFLVRTEDGGNTWKQVYPNIAPTEDISFVDAQAGFGVGTLADPWAILCTEDGGGSWHTLVSLVGKYWPEKISFVNARAGWAAVLPVGSDTNAYNTPVILQTQDGGKTWTERGKLPAYAEISYFKFFDNKNGLIITSDSRGAYYRTSDGGKTWTATSRDSTDSALDQFAFLTSTQGWKLRNPGNYQTPYAVLMSHTSDGTTWEKDGTIVSDAASYAIALLSRQKAMILVEEPPYQEDSRMELLTTEDGGKTWEPHALPQGVNGNTLVMPDDSQMPMQFTDNTHGWLLTASGLLATQDGGRTWAWQ